LTALRQTNGPASATIADDLLVFFYRLCDEYRIVQSTSNRFKGPSFSFLHEFLYQLESRPDDTLQSEEWRSFVEVLLSEMASGKSVVARK
jgi:outer membrane cobalamin receptor